MHRPLPDEAGVAGFVANLGAVRQGHVRRAGWEDYYSIRINRRYRILLRKEADDLYAVVDAGPHKAFRSSHRKYCIGGGGSWSPPN